MPLENDFLVFAGQSGANVVPQASYAGQTWQQAGFSSGIAQSAQLNKPWRQSSIMAAVLAQFIVNNSGQPAIDDGTTATLLANLQTAVSFAARSQAILVDTGSANAYAAANPAPLAANPTASGMVQKILVSHVNTAASTYAPDGLTAAPIFGMGALALQGGEMVANGIATLISCVSPLLNSGALCWVLQQCVGGAQQVAVATHTNQAVNLGQFVGSAGASGWQPLPGGWLMQTGTVATSASGYVNWTFPEPFPNGVFNVYGTPQNSGSATLGVNVNLGAATKNIVPVAVTSGGIYVVNSLSLFAIGN